MVYALQDARTKPVGRPKSRQHTGRRARAVEPAPTLAAWSATAPRAPARRPPSWPHVRLRLPAAKPPHARLPARRPLTQLPPPPPPPDASVRGCRSRSGSRDRNRPKRTRETVTSVRDVVGSWLRQQQRAVRRRIAVRLRSHVQVLGLAVSTHLLPLRFRTSGPIHATRPSSAQGLEARSQDPLSRERERDWRLSYLHA